ncbi:hypothetical protein OBBRIDRAFT_782139 [Obba rivulosa]|uniref:Aminoglycoside phosphotransferase domain-containing protein n=1 Tax=Obba rivulosa TaxID=1052685 RepID=A0A8E2DIQ9_9APHY|nr:hypothetical protein OBBRIDRAFT_782139 [Obba rivulosa]
MVTHEIYLLRLQRRSERAADNDLPPTVLFRIAKKTKAMSDISIESEVATMTYIREHTSIPVPRVYAYCPDADNSVGSPFLIISSMPGISMWSQEWEDLDLDSKLRTVRSYAHIMVELSRHTFPKIGSLYFAPEDVSETLTNNKQLAYEIGPIAWPKMCSDIRRTFPIYDRGPWTSARRWLSAAIEDELQLIRLAPDVSLDAYGALSEDIQARHAEALRVLPEMLNQVRNVTGDRWSNGPFYLAHADLSPPNILVDVEGCNAGEIVAIIDWEMASTVPVWSLLCCPDWFANHTPWLPRDKATATAFSEAYVDELHKLGIESNIAGAVTQDQWRRSFAEIALLPWTEVDTAKEWLQDNAMYASRV